MIKTNVNQRVLSIFKSTPPTYGPKMLNVLFIMRPAAFLLEIKVLIMNRDLNYSFNTTATLYFHNVESLRARFWGLHCLVRLKKM